MLFRSKEMAVFIADEVNQLYNVEIAGNGAEAITLLKKRSIQLIISDVMMPRMNGYELCKNIKEDITISHIPIVLLTARDDKQSQLSGYKNGADAYLTKPFEIPVPSAERTPRVRAIESLCPISPIARTYPITPSPFLSIVSAFFLM